MTKYIVPVSGGKDSQLCLALAVEEHGPENIIALHHFTGIDHPLTYEHMDWMANFYGVPIEHTSNRSYKDMWDLLDKRNMIPGRIARFCTDELKIKAFNQWLDKRKDWADLVVLMGMRAQESTPRMAKYKEFTPTDEFSLCDLSLQKVPVRFRPIRVRLPIVDKSTSWVFNYFRERGQKINPLYARGHKRVGCYPCILSGQLDFKLAVRDPVGRKTIITLRDFKILLAEVKKIQDPTILVKHDLDALLDDVDADPFGFYSDEPDDDEGGGCQFCEVMGGA